MRRTLFAVVTVSAALPAAVAGCASPAAPPTVFVGPAAAAITPEPEPRPSTDLTPHPIDEPGTVRGVVHFTGTPPLMRSPRRRETAEQCKEKQIRHNAVIVSGGMLRDTFVRIEVGGVPGTWKPPAEHARVSYEDCVFQPRVQGVMVDQSVDFIQRDRTLHNLHSYRNRESWFNRPMIRGADPVTKEMPDAGIVALTDDVHPWEHAFVLVTDHPFFAVSDSAGSFTIRRVPPGRYQLEAWHSRYGLKRAGIEVTAGHGVELGFTYDGKESQPPENNENPGTID